MDIKTPWYQARALTNDNMALAPVIWLIVLIGGAIAGLGVYQFTQRPDITYNISDTGFSFAGIDISWVAIIGIVGIVVFLLFFLFRKPPTKQPPTL